MAVSSTGFQCVVVIIDGSAGEKHRGIVVTVYLDPANIKNSNQAVLDRLSEGYWGPFYQP